MNDQRDRDRIDALIDAFFSAFDNRGDARPDLKRIVDCFTDRAVIVRHSKTATDFHDPVGFAQPRIELLTQGALRDFHEVETESSTAILGGIAIRTSRYRKHGVLDGSNYSGSGTKCFQLVELAEGWRICALAWVDDDGVANRIAGA